VATAWAGFGDAPELDPVVAYERTLFGWRGLTLNGEVLDVQSYRAEVPSSIMVRRGEDLVGHREVTDKYDLSIDSYLERYNRAVQEFRENLLDEALEDFDAAVRMAPTAAARFNRGLVLLTMGRWREGFESYEARLELMTPPMCREVKVKRWRGEDVSGKKILLVHDAGFGDTIQMLRYVPHLLERGADVHLLVPPELVKLASQVAPVYANTARVIEADFFCPMLSLLHLLDQTPESVPHGPYLHVDRSLVEKWQQKLPDDGKPRVGVAWSVGRSVDGDYPRAIPLGQMVAALPEDAGYYSCQSQGREEAVCHGVTSYAFEDFADCAAFMKCMDEIVTVDTAAAHVAGATGHPCVTVLLSHWASWRWLDNPFYPDINLCRQKSPGDWESALAEYRSV
jgi:tetratricopeptide (TPR) repeat protein